MYIYLHKYTHILTQIYLKAQSPVLYNTRIASLQRVPKIRH